jgi:hypothetical protein
MKTLGARRIGASMKTLVLVGHSGGGQDWGYVERERCGLSWDEAATHPAGPTAGC